MKRKRKHYKVKDIGFSMALCFNGKIQKQWRNPNIWQQAVVTITIKGREND